MSDDEDILNFKDVSFISEGSKPIIKTGTKRKAPAPSKSKSNENGNKVAALRQKNTKNKTKNTDIWTQKHEPKDLVRDREKFGAIED
jgi:hypothetical protein